LGGRAQWLTAFPGKQRPVLLQFAEALDSRASTLRRDECSSDWAIFGRYGHIFAVPEGFQLLYLRNSARAWGSAKDRLGFGKVTQGGDGEGSIIFDRLPTQAEAAEIRAVLDIPKARHLAEGQRLVLIQAGAQTRISPKKNGLDAFRSTNPGGRFLATFSGHGAPGG
jgi:hypothetical protein